MNQMELYFTIQNYAVFIGLGIIALMLLGLGILYIVVKISEKISERKYKKRLKEKEQKKRNEQ